MVGVATCVTHTKRRRMPCKVGEGTRARGGGSKGFGSGGVGGRGTAPELAC